MNDYRPNAPGEDAPFPIAGYASVWECPYRYDGQWETVEPHAFRIDRSCRILIGHNWELELSTSHRRIVQDREGLFLELRTRRCALADDLRLALKCGFLQGMSWRGRITHSSPERHLGRPCRRLRTIILEELTLTDDPACPFAFATIPGRSLPRHPIIPKAALERSRLRRLLQAANEPIPSKLKNL